MSFSTDPHTFRIGIGGKGGELLTPSAFDIEKLSIRGDLRGLRLIYRMRRKDEVRKLMGALVGDLANRVQAHWRELIYQKTENTTTRGGYHVNTRMVVNWRGDYARAVRVRRNPYSAKVYIDSTVARYLMALERGARALGERYFAGRGNALNSRHYHGVGEPVGYEEGKRGNTLFTSGLSKQQKNMVMRARVARIKKGGHAEGSERILEWARERFGAGENQGSGHTITIGKGNRAKKLRGVLTHKGGAARSSQNAIDKNAYRLLIWIRTHGTRGVGVFSRLRDSLQNGRPLQRELEQVSERWYQSLKSGEL